MATQQHRSKYDVSMKTLYRTISPVIRVQKFYCHEIAPKVPNKEIPSMHAAQRQLTDLRYIACVFRMYSVCRVFGL